MRIKSIKSIRKFIELEASGGIILFTMAVLAMIIDNTSLSTYYHLLFSLNLSIGVSTFTLSKPLLAWINEGLMTIFFLLIGLEVKRELLEGELNQLSRAILPAVAAFGGMLVPAIIYIICNWHNAIALRGWGIPVATDIAFSLGILALLGSKVPQSLRMFLLALAIFDDLGAIIIIAVAYNHDISFVMISIAVFLIFILFILNRLNVVSLSLYFVVGILLWIFILKSGIHSTLTGVIIALAIPLHDNKNRLHSPLKQLEKYLHPWVVYLILPLFAFANAGVSLYGFSWSSLFNLISVGIALGLFLGKQIGIFGFTMLSVKLGIAKLPRYITAYDIYAIAALAGVGFTMSLFIGGLAFPQLGVNYANEVRVGVICGSLLSGIWGYCLLHLKYKFQSEKGVRCLV